MQACVVGVTSSLLQVLNQGDIIGYNIVWLASNSGETDAKINETEDDWLTQNLSTISKY